MYCISISGLSFAVHMSVFSAYCVFILLHCVSLCSLVFLYSLCLLLGRFFQCEALFLHLYSRRCPPFVEVLSSCWIKASFSYFILRLPPRILYWGFVLICPLCSILRLCSSVWGFGPHCCRPLLLCLYFLFGLFAVICVWFCLFVFCLGQPDANIVWFEFLFTFLPFMSIF